MEGPDGSSPLPLKPYLERLEKTPISVNFGLLAGQGSIREAVIGLENRKATPAEIRKMKDLAREAMLDGAFGLSTGVNGAPALLDGAVTDKRPGRVLYGPAHSR
jgi:N-acyl-D-amino-acid deacylase